MNRNIFDPAVQKFLQEHLKDDVNKIALSKSPFAEISARELAEQLDGKQRAQKKLPSWFNTPGIIFPAKLSVEQSSSELTAAYKATLAQGDKLIDLTGGFGVDSYFLSKAVKELVHCEANQELSAIAKHNLDLLGSENVSYFSGDSIEYLKATEKTFDTIYVDPARRIKSRKVFLLKDTEPNVVENLDLLLSKASRIIIKTSPLFDIQSGLKELSNVSEVHVLSIKNDCKELLWVIDKGFIAEAKIISVALGSDFAQFFAFSLSVERMLAIDFYSSAPLTYLFEPDVALLKAGAFKSIAHRFSLNKLHPNTHLYTSDQPNQEFIGKTFRIVATQDYRAFCKNNPIKKANVIAKNFPYSPEELKKKHKITDGGDDFLIFTKLFPDALKVIHAVSNR